MISNSQIELISDLRSTVADIGIGGLEELTKSAPTELELNAALLEKLVELLERIVEEQDLPLSASSSPHQTDLEDVYELPCAYPGETKSDSEEGVDIVDPTYVYYTSIEVKDEADDSPADEPPRFDEVTISNSAFPELFPTKEVTQRIQLQKSFPNIDEFDGGIHILSGGNFGLTFKSILRGVPVVLKVSKKRSEEANRADYHEWSVSERLNAHPNVLQIIGLCPAFSSPMFTETGTTALIAPLQENGGLREFFDNRDPRDGDIMDIAFGMIAGIRSLHEQRVVHRDIAVRNFLVDCDGRVLLCDFGLTEFLPKGSNVFHGNRRELLPWRTLAPESRFNLEFSPKSDIWMYGLALVELILKQAPWPSFTRSADLTNAFIRKRLPKLLPVRGIPFIIRGIICDCLKFDPSDRPSADNIAERLAKSQFKGGRDEYGNTFLHRWVMIGKSSLMNGKFSLPRYLQTSSQMINAVNFNGETPLMLAKNEEIQRALLSYREIPSCNTEPSRIPEYFLNTDVFGSLLRLAKKCDVKGVKSLGRLGLHDYMNERHKQVAAYKGETPVHVAARTGNTELLDALISLNIFDVSKTNIDGQTALHVAAIHGHIGVFERLMRIHEMLEGSNHVGTNGIWKATTCSYVNTQDKRGKTALHLAARNGSLSVTKALLSSTATDVNMLDAHFMSPIFDSVIGVKTNQQAHLAVLESFLEHPRVRVNKKDSHGETILHKAAREDYIGAAHLLLKRTDLIHSKEYDRYYTPLHLATRELSAGVVETLLSNEDVKVNERDKLGNTPPHILAKLSVVGDASVGEESLRQIQSSNIARMFVSHENIRINETLQSGEETALHVAARQNNVVVAKELLCHSGIDVNAEGKNSETPLHLAAREDSLEVAMLLIERVDIRPDARIGYRKATFEDAAYERVYWQVYLNLSISTQGEDIDDDACHMYGTPLHCALSNRSVAVAKLLLSSGKVDVNARDADYRTPLHYCAKKNIFGVAEMLLLRDDIDGDARDKIGDTPLHLAARFSENKVEVAQLLLSRDDVNGNSQNISLKAPLHYAAESKNYEFAHFLLSRDDVNAETRDNHKETPLHYAAREDSVEVAKLLLSRDDVDVNSLSNKRQTPLHHAASCDSAEVAKIILSRDDVDVNARDVDGMTPLLAAIAGFTEDPLSVAIPETQDIRAALHHSAAGNSIEDSKHVREIANFHSDMSGPLYDAAKECNIENPFQFHRFLGTKELKSGLSCCAPSGVEVAKLLLSRDDVDVITRSANGKTALHIAAARDKIEIAKHLLENAGADAAAQDKHQQTSLHHAAAGNSVEVAKLLLSIDDIDANARDVDRRTPLHVAAEEGSSKVAKVLLATPGIDPVARDIRQQTPLHHAASGDSDDVAKLLLSIDDVDANARDVEERTPLHVAAEKGNTKVAKVLLATPGIDQLARDNHQQTPLHYAAAGDSFRVAKLLLSIDDFDVNARDVGRRKPLQVPGIDPVARDNRQQTPLHHAASRNSVAVAKLLLSIEDVDANARDVEERTPLHVAAEKGNSRIARVLLATPGIDPVARDNHQQTPLHYAAAGNSVEVAKLLLSIDDVDINARDADGRTALDLAEANDAAECIALLRDRENSDDASE